VAVATANGTGTAGKLTFYGSSFFIDHRGRPLVEAGRDTAETIVAEVDLDQARADRAGWGLLRDRRPDLYLVPTRSHG
jgi:N-carbamoylputrescine amidase